MVNRLPGRAAIAGVALLILVAAPATRRTLAQQAAPAKIASAATDPALRLKGYEQHVALAEASPFKSVTWQFLGPRNVSGRCVDIAVVTPKAKSYTLYVATASGRAVEDGERSNHLAADLPGRAGDDHRRRGNRAVEPRHRLGRYWRGEHLPQLPGGYRRLQVG